MKLATVFHSLRAVLRFSERRGVRGQIRIRELRAKFRRLLMVEALEIRRPLAFSITSSGNSITLTGDGADDSVVISVSPSGHFRHDLPLSGNLVSDIDTNGSVAGEQAILASSVSGLAIYGNAGNDTIDASGWTGGGMLLMGGFGNDTIKGSSSSDDIWGGGGDDFIEGNGGNDHIRGDAHADQAHWGNDTIYGGAGDDKIFGDDSYWGGNGNDILDGGDGDDSLNGSGGANVFLGGSGNDSALDGSKRNAVLNHTTYIGDGVESPNHGIEVFSIGGSAGDDILDASGWTTGVTIWGGFGNDTIKGGASSDDLWGDGGDDFIEGNGGNDHIRGDAHADQAHWGNDTIYGGAGDDKIFGDDSYWGGNGNDILDGGDGDDSLNGSGGANVFMGGSGNDSALDRNKRNAVLNHTTYIGDGIESPNHGIEVFSIGGSAGDDILDASGWTTGVTIWGGFGNDTIKGGASSDDIWGDGGDDFIEGNGGNDHIRGDAHADQAHWGNDTIYGGAGDDKIFGDDSYWGGNGNDTLDGGDGNDTLNGSGGDDFFLVSNATFSTVLGYGGYDTLIFTGADTQLDLVANNKVSGIEEINITGTGNNSLTINQARVLSLSDSTDTLIVSGNVGDSVVKGSGWTLSGTETINGVLYKNYTQGTATLKLQQATGVNLRALANHHAEYFDSSNPSGFTGNQTILGVQGYQGLGTTGNQFNANFLWSYGSSKLTLTDLPPHETLDIGFLLAIVDSWDGRERGQWWEGDYFNILLDGVPVFRESFHSVDPTLQSYQPLRTGGRLTQGTQLGFSSVYLDSAYDMFLDPRLQSIAHSATTAEITWFSDGPGWEPNRGYTNPVLESWAIDNLAINFWTYNFSVYDNISTGELVANLETNDIDPTDSFNLELTTGTGDTDNAYFSIVGNELRTAQPLVPNKTSYSIRVRATDQNGVPFDQVLNISVIPSNKAPTDIALSANSIAENQPANSTIGALTTTDPNEADTFSYSLVTGTGDADNAAFSIDGNTLKANNSFDFESKSTYSVRIRSTDQGGLFTEKVFTVSVTNVNESPTDISATSTSIAENAGANAIVGALSSSDPDAGNSFTYSLVPGSGDADNGAFNIDGNNLRANASFDFESKSSYSVRVRSTDQDGLFTEKVFTISVTDVDENVYVTGLATADTFIATYTGNGSDAGWTLTRNGATLFTNRAIPNGGALVIDGLAGSDTLQVNGRTVDDSLRLAANTITTNNAPIQFANTEIVKLLPGTGNDSLVVAQAAPAGVAISFDGGAGTDSIEALSGNNAWDITGAGIGTFNTVLSFLAIETLRGGTGDDQFVLTNAGKVTGQIHAGTGSDTLNLAAKTTAHTINLQTNTATSTGGISGFENFIGGSLSTITDVLIGPNTATTWTIDGVNSGNLASSPLGTVSFSGFESLTGGTAIDSFVVTDSGSVSQKLTGGTATGVIDTLDLSTKSIALDFRLDATTSSIPGAVGAYTGFERVTGNGLADTKVTRVNNATTAWAINTAGQISVGNVIYIHVANIVGGPGVDTLTGPNTATTWTIDGVNSGNLASSPMGTVSFSGFESLTGGAAVDSFVVTDSGSVSQKLTGGTATGVIDTLDLSAKSTALDFRLDATTSSIPGAVGAYTGFERVTGNGLADTKVTRVNNATTAWAINTAGQISVGNVIYIHVANIVGGPGVDTLTGPSLATDATVVWNVSSAGGGTLAIPGASVAFSGMNNLTGGTGADSFEILPAGSLPGAINGGTGTGLNSLSYAQWATGVTVNLAVTTAANALAIAGVTRNIQMVIGGSGDDLLQGQASKSTVLVGLEGRDRLSGGSQRDLLFGGTGADILVGSAGDDLLISGSTSHDTNRQALFAIYSEWVSTRTFAVRTANIWGNGGGTNANGQYRLNSDASDSITDTVFADSDIDSLTGGLNQDWFFASVNDTVDFSGTGAAPDRLNS